MSEAPGLDIDHPPSVAAERLHERKLEQMSKFFEDPSKRRLELDLFAVTYFDADEGAITDMASARRDAQWVAERLHKDLAIDNKDRRQEEIVEKDKQGNEWQITRWTGKHSDWPDDFFVEERQAINKDLPDNVLGLQLVVRAASKDKIHTPKTEGLPQVLKQPTRRLRVWDRFRGRKAA